MINLTILSISAVGLALVFMDRDVLGVLTFILGAIHLVNSSLLVLIKQGKDKNMKED